MLDVLFVNFYVWPDMVLNQRQVLVIVSDWELYLGSLGFTVCLWVIVPVSVFAPDRTVLGFHTFVVLLVYSCTVSLLKYNE
jgi:hypothetical protein